MVNKLSFEIIYIIDYQIFIYFKIKYKLNVFGILFDKGEFLFNPFEYRL